MNNIRLVEIAKKDHFHFTNDCYICREHIEDTELTAVWLEINNYLEPHYSCQKCLTKLIGVL